MSYENESQEGRRTPIPARLFLAVGGAVALLLLGGAGGLLLATPSEPVTEPDPNAVDIGFAEDMTIHHEQAVTMATLARERADDVAVRQLAFDIETNQRNQIGRMQGWLSLWGEANRPSGPRMQWMHGNSGGEHAAGASGQHDEGHGGAGQGNDRMPGMASSEEMRRLHSLEGPAFDVEFLQLMLRHHVGGAPMAQYGADHAQLAAVRGLAKNMLGSQSAESDLMRSMLAERDAKPLPFPG
ncbi:DUF305 domain-containing protein [Parasphingorhabdus pacifica]